MNNVYYNIKQMKHIPLHQLAFHDKFETATEIFCALNTNFGKYFLKFCRIWTGGGGKSPGREEKIWNVEAMDCTC
jgi:hypothetical protein